MRLLKILQCKCPNCEKGAIFKSSGNLMIFSMPKMNRNCDRCGFTFEKETGFFFGAMYVSYGIACALMIAAMVIMWGILKITNPLTVFAVIAGLIIVCSNYNFMLSRTIWIYFFYEKKQP